MNTSTHSELASFIWSICNPLRGPYKRNEYRKVILPLTVLGALGERDETAEICRDRHGNPEPDPELRDTESVPLKEGITEYFEREVLPHVPGAWIDECKTRIGCEIPLNRHLYRYEPARPLEVVEADIKALERENLDLLRQVTGNHEVTQ